MGRALLPAIAEKDETFRKEGEALWPEKYPLPVLEKIRTAIGSAATPSTYTFKLRSWLYI